MTTEKKERPGARGKPRLNRKRYTECVAFLKRIIAAESTTEKGIERQMRAVALLLDLYDRADKAAERRARKESEQNPAPAPVPEPEAESIPDPEDALRRAREFLARTTGGVPIEH